ncbi:MAG: hypothetical protein IT306_23845 [Chloroflexi bacterium]|nr:hypothetical protein [Chloroflexota bacterium]
MAVSVYPQLDALLSARGLSLLDLQSEHGLSASEQQELAALVEIDWQRQMHGFNRPPLIRVRAGRTLNANGRAEQHDRFTRHPASTGTARTPVVSRSSACGRAVGCTVAGA